MAKNILKRSGMMRKIKSFVMVMLSCVIALSMFIVADDVKPAKAGIGSLHKITVIYYHAVLYNDHDDDVIPLGPFVWVKDPGEWYFSIYANGSWSNHSYENTNDGDCDFDNIVRTWKGSNYIYYRVMLFMMLPQFGLLHLPVM